MNFRFSFLIRKLHKTYYKNKKYTNNDKHKNVIKYKMEHGLHYNNMIDWLDRVNVLSRIRIRNISAT